MREMYLELCAFLTFKSSQSNQAFKRWPASILIKAQPGLAIAFIHYFIDIMATVSPGFVKRLHGPDQFSLDK